MTGVTVIETRRAQLTDEGACPICGRPVERGQRIALVHDDDRGHDWIHVRHLAEPALSQATDRTT